MHLRGDGFPFPLFCHRKARLACRVPQERGPGQGRAGGQRGKRRICRRRENHGHGTRAGAEKDHAQAALHGGHLAGSHGDVRQAHHGRTGKGGYKGFRYRHARHTCRHHHHAGGTRLHRTIRQKCRTDRKRNACLRGGEGYARGGCGTDRQLGKSPVADRGAYP